MRILHVLNSIEVIGNGIVNTAVDIACVQSQLGNVVAVAAPDGGYRTLLSENGITHYELMQDKDLRGFVRAVTGLSGIIREFRPEVVHCHMMTSLLIARVLKRRGNYRLVSHIHNPHQRSCLLMGLADRTIAVSNAVAQQMIRRGIPARKMYVVHNRTVATFRSRPRPDVAGPILQQPAVVTVAGMFKHKNIDGLIAAFDLIAASFPDAHLYLVGDGPDIGEFKQQASLSAAAGRIHFEGFQPTPQAYMRQAHVFVLPSHTESFGLVLHEAREVGSAVIATRVGGIPEALDGGKAGLLVEPGDPRALADAMRRLLSDQDEVAKWKAAAKAGIERQTVWEMGREVLSTYEQPLSTGFRQTQPLAE